ncbi:MAG: type II toxin-antitoxin system prevent-host-death family antitoxin [Victivallales bacterium]|jgi:prevent-host-death family protein
METASVREIQHHLAAYLDKVSKGQEINILRRNRPVARLMAIKEENREHKANWNGHRDELKKIFGKRKPSGKLMSDIVSDARGDF